MLKPCLQNNNKTIAIITDYFSNFVIRMLSARLTYYENAQISRFQKN